MPCCFSMNEEDDETDILKLRFKLLSKKYEKVIEKIMELHTIIQELRHNNEILINEYHRLKIEYDNFFKTYYDEIEKEKK
jgi:regulator of replication initiation timing